MVGQTPGGTILIVDDDEELRARVCDLFGRAGYAVREAATGEEALRLVLEEKPGLVLLEVQLPDLSGYQVCRELRDSFGDELPIVFLSGRRTESGDRVAGLLVGADDYLVKPVALDELFVRVRRLIGRAAQPSTRANGANGSNGANGESPLTNREREVLCLVAEGMAQKEIAGRLVISPKTVGTHIERILWKLGAHSRAQAVAMAYRDGLLEPAP